MYIALFFWLLAFTLEFMVVLRRMAIYVCNGVSDSNYYVNFVYGAAYVYVLYGSTGVAVFVGSMSLEV